VLSGKELVTFWRNLQPASSWPKQSKKGNHAGEMAI